MSNAEFVINKSEYKISCQRNEKEKILELAKIIDKRVKKISKQVEEVDEKYLLALCCLTLEGEIQELKKQLESVKEENSQNTAIIDKICNKIDFIEEKIRNL
jgi:cell division protein ZapA (FtsZ GTPase activity inhibitor)